MFFEWKFVVKSVVYVPIGDSILTIRL